MAKKTTDTATLSKFKNDSVSAEQLAETLAQLSGETARARKALEESGTEEGARRGISPEDTKAVVASMLATFDKHLVNGPGGEDDNEDEDDGDSDDLELAV